MQIRDLIPWGRGRSEASAKSGGESENPLVGLQRDINRVFDDFWTRFDKPFGTEGMPRLDVSETDERVEVAVDLPGMDEKDVEVNVTDDMLTVRGEKKAEREEKKRGYYVSERSYGSFSRMVPLPPGVDASKAEATFRKGVLTVSLPKTPEAKAKVKRIEVKGG